MGSQTVPPESIFETVSRRLLDAHPADQRGRMLHAPALRTGGACYAFSADGELFVKLPAARVDELVAAGTGQPCDPSGKGRPMKQWVRLSPGTEQAWTAYLVEARNFAVQSNGST